MGKKKLEARLERALRDIDLLREEKRIAEASYASTNDYVKLCRQKLGPVLGFDLAKTTPNLGWLCDAAVAAIVFANGLRENDPESPALKALFEDISALSRGSMPEPRMQRPT